MLYSKYNNKLFKLIIIKITNIPITKAEQPIIYSKMIKENSFNPDFEPLIPC